MARPPHGTGCPRAVSAACWQPKLDRSVTQVPLVAGGQFSKHMLPESALHETVCVSPMHHPTPRVSFVDTFPVCTGNTERLRDETEISHLAYLPHARLDVARLPNIWKCAPPAVHETICISSKPPRTDCHQCAWSQSIMDAASHLPGFSATHVTIWLISGSNQGINPHTCGRRRSSKTAWHSPLLTMLASKLSKTGRSKLIHAHPQVATKSRWLLYSGRFSSMLTGRSMPPLCSTLDSWIQPQALACMHFSAHPQVAMNSR